MMSEENMEGDSVKDTEASQVDELRVELLNKTKEELVEELYGYKRVWDCVDEETRYMLLNMGYMFTVTQRNYNTKVGILTKVWFQPARFFMAITEKVFDGTTGGYVTETKELGILANNALAYGRVYERDFENP